MQMHKSADVHSNLYFPQFICVLQLETAFSVLNAQILIEKYI